MSEGSSNESESQDELSSLGRRDQFVRLLLQHERRLYSYILSLVPRWNGADEIYQETVLRLWKEFDRFDLESSFAAWAVQVAHYQILTWRKRVHRSRLVFSRETIELIIDEQTKVEAKQEDARNGALGRCIEKLNDRNRDLLARCYTEGAQLKDVAKQLDRSLDSVYKSLQRIRLMLHECISEQLLVDGKQ